MRIKTRKVLMLMYDKGLKTGDVAKVSGLSKQTICAIRSGKGCTYETADKLAKALDVSLADIAEG